MFSYNTSVHESTKFTPYELIYGKKARQPSSMVPNDSLNTYPDFVHNLMNKLINIREIGRNNLENSKLRQKHYYDRKISPVQYHRGEEVMLLKPKRNKFSNEYDGPYVIMDVHTAQTIVADRDSIAFELTRAGFFVSLTFYSIS